MLYVCLICIIHIKMYKNNKKNIVSWSKTQPNQAKPSQAKPIQFNPPSFESYQLFYFTLPCSKDSYEIGVSAESEVILYMFNRWGQMRRSLALCPYINAMTASRQERHPIWGGLHPNRCDSVTKRFKPRLNISYSVRWFSHKYT